MNLTGKETLNLIELFASVQGETSFSGLPTTFVRLARCNLRCSWCDTPYSFVRGTPYSLASIITQIEQFGCRYVCVTGGEPLLQENVHPLMRLLLDKNYIVNLETSGSLSISKVDPRTHIILDIKCPASGMSHKNLWANLELIKPDDQVKFVIQNEKDYLYAKEVCESYHLYGKIREILFSPVHNLLDSKLLVAWILRDKLPVRLNLQIHKFIWSPETKGV
jgi:7-carboxy-7-deazaguanine synthase